MTAALEGGEWSAARPGRNLPPGKTRYPFYRRLGWPQGRSGRAENLVLTGIRSRTVHSVVSRYTDWATRPTREKYHWEHIDLEGNIIFELLSKYSREVLDWIYVAENKENGGILWILTNIRFPKRAGYSMTIWEIISILGMTLCKCWIHFRLYSSILSSMPVNCSSRRM